MDCEDNIEPVSGALATPLGSEDAPRQRVEHLAGVPAIQIAMAGSIELARKSQQDARVLTLFRDQGGVVIRPQLPPIQFSDRMVSSRLKNGSWIQLRPGVYRNALFPESDRMKINALTLDGRGYVSHRHAGHLHGLDPDLMIGPEVTVRRGSHLKFEGVTVHESTQVRTADIEMIDGYPVSGVERTIMDIAATEPLQWKLLAIIDSARENGKTDLKLLEACLARHARQGRDGTVRFRNALEAVRPEERPAASPISREVAESLHARGLPYPILEEDIRDRTGALIARADLSWPRPVLVFLDGFTYHGKRRRQTSEDRRKRQILRSMGFVVMEFTYDQWITDPAFVIRETVNAYYAAPAAWTS